MALIKCPMCGHTVSDKARACPKCFTPINHNTLPTPPPNTNTRSSSPQREFIDEPKHSNKGWLIAIEALLIVGIGVFVYLLVNKDGDKTPNYSRNESTVQSDDGSFASKIFSANGVDFKMIAVEGGTFTMGATAEQDGEAESNEKPTHQVTLNDYYIGETEVTQALWKAVMGSNPSKELGDNNPIESISWNDCQEFIQRLNHATGMWFRLPTEAEWEFAARGGNQSHGYKYSGSNNANDVAWHKDNSGETTQPVATKQANELGIYDMSGNIREWCEDRWSEYTSDPQTNPKGPTTGKRREGRGGCMISDSRYCRVSERKNSIPANNGYALGMRLAMSK